MTAAVLRVYPGGMAGVTVEAEVCPDCRALLPPCATEDREVHLERCRRLTILLALSEPPTGIVLQRNQEPPHV